MTAIILNQSTELQRADFTAAPAVRDQQPASIYLAGLSEASRRPQSKALSVIADILTGQGDIAAVAWHRLRFQHCKLLRTMLSERYTPATANRHISALRGTLKAARKLHLVDPVDYMDCLDDLASVKGERVAKGRSLSAGEIQALLTACADDVTPLGMRDAAIIAILRIAGLRRAEIVSLDIGDLDTDAGTLKVMGKGNKERLAHIRSGARAALDDWLTVRGDAPGPLFCQIRRGGHIKLARLSAQSVMDILAKRGKQADVANFSPHDLRRTLAGDLLDSGVDIAIVQRILGHADISTTVKYDRRPEQAKRQAVSKIHVPYTRRFAA